MSDQRSYRLLIIKIIDRDRKLTIRVAHIVNPTFGSVFSGHTHYLFSLLSGWKDDTVTFELLGTQIKPFNLNSGEREYVLPQGSFWSKPKRQNRWGNIRWSFDLLKLLINRRNDYEIVHFHTLGWGSLLSPLILHLLKKKVVFTMSLMGNDNPSYIRKQPRGRLQVALMRQFDGAIGLAPALVDDAFNNGIRNVICLPNFLSFPQLEEPMQDKEIEETRLLAREKLGIPRESKVLLYVGSIIQRKGVDILIEVFIKLASVHPDLILLLVGPQSKSETNSINEEYVDQLKQSIKSAGLDDRVIWTGMIREQSAIVQFYRASDIFVLPTRNEGSPNVLAEAMSANLPVVISKLPGITDAIITDNINGCLVTPDDSSGFFHAIDELLVDPIKRDAMGAAGKVIATNKFGFEAYCQKLKDFYLGLFRIQHDISS